MWCCPEEALNCPKSLQWADRGIRRTLMLSQFEGCWEKEETGRGERRGRREEGRGRKERGGEGRRRKRKGEGKGAR